jgi:hypothetical protein
MKPKIAKAMTFTPGVTRVRNKNHSAIYRMIHNGRFSSQEESLTFANPSAFRDRRSHGRKGSSDAYGLLVATALARELQYLRGDLASNAFRSPWQMSDWPVGRTLSVCPHQRADLLSEVTGDQDPRQAGPRSSPVSSFTLVYHRVGQGVWLRLNAWSNQLWSVILSQLEQHHSLR